MRIPVRTAREMVSAVERGESVASVACRFEVAERELHKLLRRYRERGTLEPRKPGPKGPTKLTPTDDANADGLPGNGDIPSYIALFLAGCR